MPTKHLEILFFMMNHFSTIKFDMSRILLSIIAVLTMAFPTVAQMTAKQAFATAPQRVIPLLDKNARLDMIDYFEAGQTVESRNALDGKSMLTELQPLSLKARLSDSSSLQLALLPAGNDTIVALITTVNLPSPDSSMQLYDSQWQPISGQRLFTPPLLADWLTDSKKAPEVEAVVPFMVAQYDYDPTTQTLTVTNCLSRFLSDDIYSMVNNCLRSTLTYRWNGKQFRKQ